jgi:hypothetical protein
MSIIRGIIKFFDKDWTTGSSSTQFSIVSSDGTVIAKCDRYGQWQFRGKGANPKLEFINSLGNTVINFNTLSQNGYFDVCSSDGTVVCHLDSNGISKLLGLDVQNNKIINVLDGVDVSDATNLGQVQTLIANLVNAAPSTLNTLKELADALGDDPNFAATVTTALGNRELLSNKSTSIVTDQASDTKYASVKSIFTWVNGLISGLSSVFEPVINKSTGILTWSGSAWVWFTGTLSGNNTGDETISTIKTKLEITTFSDLETTDKTLIGSINELFTDKEVAGVAAGLIVDLKDGVSSAGDTLQKLYNLIVGSFSEITVGTIADRDAYNVDHLPLHIFVTDDGDGHWALYKATTTGVGATFVKISDPDLLNAVMTATQIKASYESNSDTNAFSNAYKGKIDSITAIFTTALKAAYDAAVINSHTSGSDNQTATTVPIIASGFSKNLNNGITNVQLLANAVDQLSAGSNGIPNPVVYSYTGGLLTKEIETIIGGTIEKRYRYYSGGSAQDGSMDIAEIRNTVTNDFERVTCLYTGGYITSRTLTTITAFTI